MKKLINKFLRDESGATMVEYAILVALISVAVIATVYLVGQEVNDKFDEVKTALENNGAPGGTGTGTGTGG